MSTFDIQKILSPVVTGIPPSGIRKFFDIVSEMKDAISLGVGEPDFVTPTHIREAGIASLEDGHTHYTSNSGLAELRREIAAYMKRRFELEYDGMHEVLVSVGGSEAIDLALRAILCPGDEVLVPEPSFVCYKPDTVLAGGVAVPLETKEEDNFALTPETLRAAITPRTKALVLPYPNNPTGGIMTRAEVEAIAEVLEGTNILVISDEIYAELTYGDERHFSIARIPSMRERTLIVSGFSKAYAMTGWRLGYACGPQELIAAMTKIHQFAIMSAPTMSQYAAIAALRDGDDDIERMKREYNRRRRLIVDGFRRMGLSCFEPLGAFYVFPCIRNTGFGSNEFCERLLEEEKVAVVPGNAFGESGEGFVRCSYAYSVEQITEALRRIERFVKRHKENSL
ncbi:MAG TPA: aminotransferase class I/II-fold pyridoxal phosphate-dependent enzyme [Candidatus Aphodoplasma excrementigallinarum]|uniref:Aminotransferase n=1 Tax=Candidatus Aphodoplasma excrementigallinarum TaxID=2840673 RepID=A0A9D1T049_9FIRM|nr:aminotransferase class I/II-fold pyridoxal phosphate-dependent enzyme [Candidatus Aphodoplasma excrementigallinarum]